MNSILDVYNLWLDNQFPSLSLDEALETVGGTHKELRKSVQYPLTTGCKTEIRLEVLSGRSIRATAKLFKCTEQQVANATYQDIAVDKAVRLQDVLSDIRLGTSQTTIADKYGITQSRVSQLAKLVRPSRKQRARAPLTEDEVEQIKTLDCQTAMTKFNISKTTYYKVLKR